MSDLVEPDMTRDEALAITDRIRGHLEDVWELVKQAYTRRAWLALGYESWDVYCIREFDTARLRIPREERPELVASLRAAGMSIRAIESATGLGYGTVRRELSGEPNGSPEPEDQEPEPTETSADRAPELTRPRSPKLEERRAWWRKQREQQRQEQAPELTVVGRDGKSYSAGRDVPAPRPRPRSPLTVLLELEG